MNSIFRRIWIPLMPLFNRRESGRVETHLRSLCRKRISIVLETLQVPNTKVADPKIAFTLAFFLPTAVTLGGRIYLNAHLVYYATDQEICRTIDHELTHYVQLTTNKKLRWFNFWKVDARKFFVEGFAEFVTSLTRKNSPGKKVTEGITRGEEG